MAEATLNKLMDCDPNLYVVVSYFTSGDEGGCRLNIQGFVNLQTVKVEYLPGALNVSADCLSRLVEENRKDEEQKDINFQEELVCEVCCDVSEVTCGIITEQEWKEALKEDVELSGVCEVLETGKFEALGKFWRLMKDELAVDKAHAITARDRRHSRDRMTGCEKTVEMVWIDG
ncbi:hypothetical protein NDU88_007428 [Pleurodeles waltl]|uniref:Uncharacterized protein n=1 Tax=Pleurodeles waltl TaxID=8319 RepID=A0AAV7NVY0_PLEWA|nr:hypothetical protein NDU88_007428 [Pleurodeles waltl]